MPASAFGPECSLDFFICQVGRILRRKQLEKKPKKKKESRGTLVEVDAKNAILIIILLFTL